MSVIHVTKENFESVVTTDKPVLLDFWATWCGPCRMIAPVIEEIGDEHPEYVVGKINVDDESALASEFGIMSIPTLVVIKNGKITGQIVGVRPKDQILELIELFIHVFMRITKKMIKAEGYTEPSAFCVIVLLSKDSIFVSTPLMVPTHDQSYNDTAKKQCMGQAHTLQRKG